MFDEYKSQLPDADPDETREWCQALQDVVAAGGAERARYLLTAVLKQARTLNVGLPPLIQTPYINTIPPEREARFPGDAGMEKRIRRIIRWNAMAMVTRANQRVPGIGGHLSSYASAASLYEVGFNHFFRGPDAPGGGDLVYIQGHAAPGIYARAFLEGRLSEARLEHFRRELAPGAGRGLSSYPHPWLMPDFWQFPTVSMGLGPLTAIYQARFMRYLHNRGLADTSQRRVWAFLGDGECDEPEALGALSVAAREGLDNLIFVVNCNLQRLDGPVRGNGKIVQELEAAFRGAGWHVIKVLWGPEWDPLLARDVDGLLLQRMNETVDGQFQKYSVSTGAYIREHFFGSDPRLRALVDHLSDEQLTKLRRGGHSQRKLYAAYDAATEHLNAPVAILAKTVKGWTLGEGFEASNVTHQMKKLDLEQLRVFRDTLHLPIPDERLAEAPYYHPGPASAEVEYVLERRRLLGGMLPQRRVRGGGSGSGSSSSSSSSSFGQPAASLAPLAPPPALADEARVFDEFRGGSKSNVAVSTTMACVRLLRSLMRDKGLGRYVVPIIPDEARTFGMDAFFREFGIYAALGQKYTPVDSELLLNYHESQSGQLLEEGITEAGSMASFTAAGTAHVNHGVTTIPFYLFYSMFGFQRTADQIWAFGDARGRGFLLGATAGRTTLSGEGLQHQDGHSQLVAMTVPNLLAYDPAYAYELAVIVREGLLRMLARDEDVFYYLTLYNENYVMPAQPAGIEESIVRGGYLLRPAPIASPRRVQLFGSGPIVGCALEAQQWLAEHHDVAADVWSITSYQQLYRQARACERRARIAGGAGAGQDEEPYVAAMLRGHDGPVIASSDWVQELPALLARFIPRPFFPLGTNGYGRCDTREALRRHFEIDAAAIVVSALQALSRQGQVAPQAVQQARRRYQIDAARPDPAEA